MARLSFGVVVTRVLVSVLRAMLYHVSPEMEE
jgi:hypothetical protein